MSNNAKAIGIDFGGTSIKSAVVRDGVILHQGDTIDTGKFDDADSLIADLVLGIRAMQKRHPEVEATGVGVPGFVDSINGIVHHVTNVPGWREVPLVRLLRERTGLRTVIENDANAMAYGEFLHGAARGARNAVCVTLGTGVGGGLILEGRLFRGSRLAAAELGHVSIDLNGPPGVYGTFGDLEQFVGNRQIAQRAARLYAEVPDPKPVEECTPADLARLADAGDRIAIALWDTIGTEIATVLVNAVWLLNPDTIVIGGGVAAAGELILNPIRRTIRERTIPLFYEELKVAPAMLGNDAGIIGCAALALESE
jgi:glucokinase